MEPKTQLRNILYDKNSQNCRSETNQFLLTIKFLNSILQKSTKATGVNIMDFEQIGQRTPAQCKNGPIPERSMKDFFCCTIYLLLIALVIFLILFHANGIKMTPAQIQISLNENQYGRPLLAIFQTKVPIVVALMFVAALSMVIVITTFTMPILVAYFYMPLTLFSMLLLGVIFILRFLDINIPFIHDELQNNYAKGQSLITFIIGCSFIAGFVIASITLVVKRQKIPHIIYVLRIARIAFWPNWYMLIFSILFTVLSISALTGNLILLSLCITTKSMLIPPSYTVVLIIIQTLWTHGFIEALSDFFFQSIAIHWYHKKRRQFMHKSSFCDTLCLTFKMVFFHIGTIAYGQFLAFVPQIGNIILGRCERWNPLCYYAACFWHCLTFKRFTKYCYFQTILQNLDFCTANKEMYGLRKRTKQVLPKLYMIGNFYETLTKIFSVMSGLIICYFLIGNSQLSHIFGYRTNILGPLFVTLLGSLQISNHFLNASGVVGDTLVFSYSADSEIQKKYFGVLQPYNCPYQILDIIYETKLGKQYI